MRFLIDANLPRAAIVVCQKFGHQVEFARDIGLAAASDAQIADHTQQGFLDQILSILPRSSFAPYEYQQAGKMRGAVRIRLRDIERTESHIPIEKYWHRSAHLWPLATGQRI